MAGEELSANEQSSPREEDVAPEQVDAEVITEVIGADGAADAKTAAPDSTEKLRAEIEIETERAKVAAIEKRVAKLGAEVEHWKSRAYRATADLENGRKRFSKEREELRRFALEGLLKDILPVADNLERATAHATAQEGSLLDGVKMVLNQFNQVLERRGAKPFDALGQPFDPQFHEAMQQFPRDDVEPGTVIEVFQRGWKLHDRLARPAMVIVSRAPDPPAREPEPVSSTEFADPADPLAPADASETDEP